MLVRFGDLGFGLGRDFAALDELRRDVDRIFDGPGRERAASAEHARGLLGVALHDEGDALVLEADVPGFEKDEIHVSIERETLTLRGEPRAPAAEDGAAPKRPRRVARFARAFALPLAVDAEKATATLRNGILELRLPKQSAAKPRQIAVNAA